MQTKLFYIILAILPLYVVGAEIPEASGLKLLNCKAQRKGSLVDLSFQLDCSQVIISPNEQLEVQPVLIGKTDTLQLSPIFFTGNIRNKVNHRLTRFGEKIPVGYANYKTKLLAEASHTRITYSQQFTFRNWMYGSRLVLINKITGCAECQRKLEDIPLTYIPKKLAVSYIVPQPEQKVRHKNVSLYLNFHQGKSNILPLYMNNQAELAKADSLVTELKDAPYIVVDSITIIGYASPEGNYTYNTQLSGKRAQALKEYLEKKYMPVEYKLTTSAASEDWEGLRKEIYLGNLPNRKQLLSIIDSISTPDARDYFIRRLDGGVTYTHLLHKFYPSLRRVMCDAKYTIKPFTTEQAKQRLSTAPEQLNLNEMYLIAQSYPTGSTQFNELFVIMLSNYPDNVAAKNNLAAVALLTENAEWANSCLESIRNLPEVQNNLGILLYMEGKVEEAKHCFEKAYACGCKEAIYNLQEINTLLAIQ